MTPDKKKPWGVCVTTTSKNETTFELELEGEWFTNNGTLYVGPGVCDEWGGANGRTARFVFAPGAWSRLEALDEDPRVTESLRLSWRNSVTSSDLARLSGRYPTFREWKEALGPEKLEALKVEIRKALE